MEGIQGLEEDPILEVAHLGLICWNATDFG